MRTTATREPQHDWLSSRLRRPAVLSSTVPAAVATLAAALAAGSPPAPAAPAQVTIAEDHKPLVRIYAVAPQSRLKLAAADLRHFLSRMVGGQFVLETIERLPVEPGPGIYLGTAEGFGGMGIPGDLAGEEFVLRTCQGSRVLLAGGDDAGSSHAVYALLEKLRCRWFFPGKVWEVVPKSATVRVSLDERQKPDYRIQRRFFIGHGAHSPGIAADFAAWNRRNRMGNPLGIVTRHSWPFDPRKEMAAHPEWYAMVKGKRPTVADVAGGKPCYSNPEVIAAGIARAMKHFETHPAARMISVSAPDGGGFCECPLCLKRARVTQTHRGRVGFLFGKTPDGQTVSVASETIFHYANEVARAVAKRYPGRYVGILAYSAYSHPPSFDLGPNVYVELTAGFRSTPLTYAEQIEAFGRRARNVGAYEYYDVEQWSWELPGKARAADLDYLAASIAYYHRNHITSLLAEISNNWGPHGVGYYIASKLLWNAAANARAIEEDFCQKAFGPAAEPMRRFYRRWEGGMDLDETSLAMAYRDLREAAERTAVAPRCRARVDGVRMYAHFLKHYVKPPATVNQAPRATQALREGCGRQEALRKVQYLGDFTRRLMDTHMVHTYPFNGFLNRFGRFGGMADLKFADWQKPGPIPTGEEVDRLFAQDLRGMDLSKVRDVPVVLYSRDLVPVGSSPAATAPSGPQALRAGFFRKGMLYVPARRGDAVEMSFATGKGEVGYDLSYLSRTTFQKRWEGFEAKSVQAGKTVRGKLQFTAADDGFYRIHWQNGTPRSLNRPAVMIGGASQFVCNRADLYFYVPKGTRRFVLKTSTRADPEVTVRDGRGRAVFERRGGTTRGRGGRRTRLQEVIDVPAGADGAVWSVSGPDDDISYAPVELIGVPNYLSFRPEQLLVPAEALRR